LSNITQNFIAMSIGGATDNSKHQTCSAKYLPLIKFEPTISSFQDVGTLQG